MRFPIDVSSNRVCLQQLVVLRLESGDTELDAVHIDTGSAFGVSGPVGPWMPTNCAREKVHTLNGEMWAHRFEAYVRLRDGAKIWDIPDRVVVVLHENWKHWLLGMQAMRGFHLLLPWEELATADEPLHPMRQESVDSGVARTT